MQRADAPLGVFVHLYYPEFAEEICGYLRNLPGDFAIYVSTDTDEKRDLAAAVFARHFPSHPRAIKVLANRGWDIGPFVVGFAEEIRRHPFGIKVHAKKSDNQRDAYLGLRWRTHILGELLGSRQRAAEALETLKQNPDVGIVSATHWPESLPHIRIGVNYRHMKALLDRIGVTLVLDQPIDFPSGSMFWFRREALQPLLKLNLQFQDFDIPSNQTRDGTLAHAIERSIYFFSEKAGLTHRVLPLASQDATRVGNLRFSGIGIKTRLYLRVLAQLLTTFGTAAATLVSQKFILLNIAFGWSWSALTLQRSKCDTYATMWTIERSGLFDREFYLARHSDVKEKRSDPLFHYVTEGASASYDPQVLFDASFYLENNADVAVAGMNPLHHYALYGWREGRAPHPEFDGNWYRQLHADVADRNPLHHYTHYGKTEGRRTRSARSKARVRIEAPLQRAWASVPKLAGVTDAIVDVIVPVYRGYDDTLVCIHSVLHSLQKTRFELVVINDAGPDERLNAELRTLAEQGHFTYLQNRQNLGFVQTANQGISLHEGRDVILLNSDTIVYGDWIDRMLRHAEADDTIATISPLSNNATICSYPLMNDGGNDALETGFDRLDRFTAEVNAGSRNEVPTGVGFCFYMRREAIKKIGTFDAETFGRGYGEENDFCMRAKASGFRNVLAHDIYVYHTGEVSYSESRNTLRDDAQKKLHAKHPYYPALVAEYIAADPGREARVRLDARRIAEVLAGRMYVFVTHAFGGGTERYVKDLADLGKSGDAAIVIFRAGSKNRISVELPEEVDFLETPNIHELDAENGRLLVDVLKILAPRLVHLQSVAGLRKEAIAALLHAIQSSGVPYVFTWHDHMPLCHRIQFVKPGGNYCGEPPVEACRDCLRSDWSAWNEFDPAERREIFGALLSGASSVIAPSENAALRASRLVKQGKVIVKPHPEPVNGAGWIANKPEAGNRLRVAVVGAITRHKGAKLLAAMAADAEARKLPIEFVLIGYAKRLDLVHFPNVRVTGKYDGESEAVRLLQETSPQLCLIPSIWPETYCYTLSLALQAGVPPVVFDLGAQAERVRAAGWGRVLPNGIENDPRMVNDLLLAMPLEEMWAERKQMRYENPKSLSDYYEDVMR